MNKMWEEYMEFYKQNQGTSGSNDEIVKRMDKLEKMLEKFVGVPHKVEAAGEPTKMQKLQSKIGLKIKLTEKRVKLSWSDKGETSTVFQEMTLVSDDPEQLVTFRDDVLKDLYENYVANE